MENHPSPKIGLTTRTLTAILVLTVAVAAVAGATILTHTFPSIPPTPGVASVNSPCTTLTSSIESVAPESSGSVVFDCNRQAALAVSSTGTAYPKFTLPAGYTCTFCTISPVGLVLHDSALTTCAQASGGIQWLVSGSAFQFNSAGAAYDYCLYYTNAPSTGLEIFTISWSTTPTG